MEQTWPSRVSVKITRCRIGARARYSRFGISIGFRTSDGRLRQYRFPFRSAKGDVWLFDAGFAVGTLYWSRPGHGPNIHLVLRDNRVLELTYFRLTTRLQCRENSTRNIVRAGPRVFANWHVAAANNFSLRLNFPQIWISISTKWRADDTRIVLKTNFSRFISRQRWRRRLPM